MCTQVAALPCFPVECPVFINTGCVFYNGENLPNSLINKNDTLTVAFSKIDAVLSGGITPELQGLQSVLNVSNTVEYDDGNSIVQLLEGTAGNRESYIYSGDDDMSAGLSILKNTVTITGYTPSIAIETQGVIQVNSSMPQLLYIVDLNTTQKVTTVEFNTPVTTTVLKFPAKTTPGTYVLTTLDDVFKIINATSITFSTYTNDAAADADTTLPSGALYKITGNRQLFQKP